MFSIQFFKVMLFPRTRSLHRTSIRWRVCRSSVTNKFLILNEHNYSRVIRRANDISPSSCANANRIAIDEKTVPWASPVLKFPSSTLAATRITNFIRSKICFIQCHVTCRFLTYSHADSIIWLASSIPYIHKINQGTFLIRGDKVLCWIKPLFVKINVLWNSMKSRTVVHYFVAADPQMRESRNRIISWW